MNEVVELAVFVLPAASVNAPLAIETEPVPLCVSAVGVKTTEYTVEEVALTAESVPPVTVMSSAIKFVEASDRVNVNVEF